MLAFSEVSLTFKNQRDPKSFPGIEKVWKYLADRGVDRGVADACGLHIMPAIELIAAARRSPVINGADNRAAVIFPHWKLGQTEPIDWWSARLVPTGSHTELRVVTSFSDYVDNAVPRKMGKMFCPPNEAPHAYLPPIFPWKNLIEGQRVYIHESALKALNGAILGYASIGLNGVWGWSSKKHNIALIEELRDLPWKAKKLQPVIVFDSNAWDNWQVQSAETHLASKLYEITGQRAVALRVPKNEGEDQGFDDYRQLVGDKAAREFLNSDGVQIEISDIQQLMLELNTQVCVVRELGRIADQITGDLMTRQVFTDVNYAHYTAEVEERTVNIPRLWLSDAQRVEVQSLEYYPGLGRLVPNERGGLPNLNLWRGMGCEPEPGDVEPWLELLANNVESEELREWIIAWLAYPLQNPGAKLNSYLLLFGPSGMGKNLFFKPFHTIYGRNAVTIGTDALKSTFTSLYAQRQFVHADELVRARGAEDYVSQRIKAMTTSEKITVNRKGQPEYDIRNCINLAITSNYVDCVKLDPDDRRATVIKWQNLLDRRGDQSYWINYVRWAEGVGSAALYHWLLNHDISWFDPAAWAPATEWKEHVKEASMAPIESWVADLWHSADDTLGLIGLGKAIWTAKELAVLYYGMGENELSPGHVKAMVNCLRNQGFQQANDGKLLRRPKGGNADRFWVIRQREKTWGLAECSEHLKKIG